MSESENHHGGMDISQQSATWEGFVTLVKWSTIACAIFAFVAIVVVQ